MKQVTFVIGLGYGDEGKGMVTAKLVAASPKPMVVRFNGGHQAGHNVVKGEISHIFSSFGSGTLYGAPTYWSKYCTVYPPGLVNEYHQLQAKGITPRLYIDPMCPITTWLDGSWNRETCDAHSSVGVGFGQTLERNEQHYTLYAKDLKYPTVLRRKLEQISIWYGRGVTTFKPEVIESFIANVDEMLSLDGIVIDDQPLYSHQGNYIFEGAQGVLLDQRFGFFPYVTRSNTTTQNGREFLKDHFGIGGYMSSTYMVIRAYQTRHGKGPLSGDPIVLQNNEKETNVKNAYQGEFRTSKFDLEMLRYAIECEETNGFDRKSLVMTCIDHVEEIPLIITSGLVRASKCEVLYNSTPEGNFI